MLGESHLAQQAMIRLVKKRGMYDLVEEMKELATYETYFTGK